MLCKSTTAKRNTNDTVSILFENKQLQKHIFYISSSRDFNGVVFTVYTRSITFNSVSSFPHHITWVLGFIGNESLNDMGLVLPFFEINASNPIKIVLKGMI